MMKILTKLLIILFATAVTFIFLEGLMRIWDDNWEHDRIQEVGWKGYCMDMSTVNPKHYLKCDEVFREDQEANSTVQYDLED